MEWETNLRAQTIVKRGGVFFVEASPKIFHFKVQQRSGSWADVYYHKDLGWNCGAITPDKKWSCSLFTGDKTEPFCSHTLAAKIHLKNLEMNTCKKI